MVIDFDHIIARTQCILRGVTYVFNDLPDEEGLQKLHEQVMEFLSDISEADDRRKIYLFILLNGDADFIEAVAEDRNFSHLLYTLPRLSQNLLLRLILNTNGVFFLRELISFAPSAVSIPVINAILSVDELHPSRFKDMFIALEFSKACFRKLLWDSDEHIAALQKMFVFFQTFQEDQWQCLPVGSDDCHLSSKSLRKAVLLIHNLEICLSIFQDECGDRATCWEGYLIKCRTDLEKCIDKQLPQAAHEMVRECRNIVISNCYNVAQTISVEDWVTLADIKFNTSETYQQCIGKLAWEVQVKLKENREIEENFVLPDLCSLDEFLTPFAIMPKDPSNANIEDIKKALENDSNDKKVWLKALVQNSNLSKDQDTIDIIRRSTGLLDTEDIKILFKKTVSVLEDDTVGAKEKEACICFLYQVTKSMSLEDLKEVYKIFTVMYRACTDISGSEFSSQLQEAFNKAHYSSRNYEIQCEILRLALLNPVAVIQKSLQVGIQNSDAPKLMASILQILMPLSRTIVSDWILEISKNCRFQKSEMNLFPGFIVEVAQHEVIAKDDLLKLHIAHSIKQAIVCASWSEVCMWLTTMGMLLSRMNDDDSVCTSAAVLVLYVGQVLEYSQQSIMEHSHICLEARVKALQILDDLKQFSILESEQKWIQARAQNFSTTTQVHLKPFWTYECPSQKTSEYELCFNFHVNIPEYAVYILAEMIPFLTIIEWRGLANVLRQRFNEHDDCAYSIFQSFEKAISLLLAACTGVNFDVSPRHISCLNYLLCCLGEILKNVGFEVKTSNVLHVLEEIIYLLSKMPGQVWDTAVMTLLPDLVKLMGKLPPKAEVVNSLLYLISICPINETRAHLESHLRATFCNIIKPNQIDVKE